MGPLPFTCLDISYTSIQSQKWRVSCSYRFSWATMLWYVMHSSWCLEQSVSFRHLCLFAESTKQSRVSEDFCCLISIEFGESMKTIIESQWSANFFDIGWGSVCSFTMSDWQARAADVEILCWQYSELFSLLISTKNHQRSLIRSNCCRVSSTFWDSWFLIYASYQHVAS